MTTTSPAEFMEMVSTTIYVWNNLAGGWVKNGFYFILGLILGYVVFMFIIPIIFKAKSN